MALQTLIVPGLMFSVTNRAADGNVCVQSLKQQVSFLMCSCLAFIKILFHLTRATVSIL
jgi:hypothetical protein